MAEIGFEYPVFAETTKQQKEKEQKTITAPPPPIQPSERKITGEEMPPRRLSSMDSKRLFFQNIDKESPNGPPRQLAPSISELRDRIVYRDDKGRRYALAMEKEAEYLQGTIDAILRTHSSGDVNASFMWVILPPSSKTNMLSSSWPMVDETLQLETTIPVFKVEPQKTTGDEDKRSSSNSNKPLKKQQSPPLRFEASVVAVASGGPAQQWHRRKTSWVILVPRHLTSIKKKAVAAAAGTV
jgi:hypothetical protein